MKNLKRKEKKKKEILKIIMHWKINGGHAFDRTHFFLWKEHFYNIRVIKFMIWAQVIQSLGTGIRATWQEFTINTLLGYNFTIQHLFSVSLGGWAEMYHKKLCFHHMFITFK